MNIREVDLRINRNNHTAGQVDTHRDLKRRIVAAWRVYNESHDPRRASEAYADWCRLVDELDAVELLE